MTTITGLNSLRESSVQAGWAEGTFSGAWSGEIIVATAWLAPYVVILPVTINSGPLSRAIEIIARN
jgi:hypothetical protein